MGSIKWVQTGVKLINFSQEELDFGSSDSVIKRLKPIKITDSSIKKLSSSSIGDITEYKAVIWLIENNFKVFKNSECTGPIDLIAVSRTGEIKFIDVKTNHKPSNRSEVQKELGVTFLRPDEKGGFLFMKHKPGKRK